MSHTIKVIAAGFALLAICLIVARFVPGSSQTNMACASLVFIALWLVGAGINMWIGVAKAGYSVAEEAPIFHQPCRLFAAIVALCVPMHVSPASAQVANGPEVALLVLSPTPLQRGHALVERRVALKPHDIVLVDDGATEADLAGALQMLVGMRAQAGDSISTDLRAVVTKFTPGPDWRGGRDEAEKRQLVRNLPKAPFREVAGHGRVRAFPIVVPANKSKKST